MDLRIEDGEVISSRESRDVKILAADPELTVTWSRYAPGEQGPGLHVHHEHTDAFYIIEGELTFRLGPDARSLVVGAGGFVAVLPNIAHGFANEGDAEARWLNFHAPDAGFAGYMRAARDGVERGFDSFDPPADGGLPADGAVITGPGEGERLAEGQLVKCVLPDLCVIEAGGDVPAVGLGIRHSFDCGDGRLIAIEAPPPRR